MSPTTTGAMASASEPVTILYTNWRGETAVRRIIVSDCADDGHCTAVRYGSTEWHPGPQWLLAARDLEKDAHRDFALSGIKAWGQEAVDAALAAPAPVVPEEVRRALASGDEAVFCCACARWVRTLLAATPSKPVGDGGEAANRVADQIWAAIGALETPERASGVENAEASAQVLGHAVDTAKSILRAALRNAESIETASAPPAGGGVVEDREAVRRRLIEAYEQLKKLDADGDLPVRARDKSPPDSLRAVAERAVRMLEEIRAEDAAQGRPWWAHTLAKFALDDLVYALAAAPAAPEPAAAEALRGISDDFMTSDRHHPGYVLIPAAKFEQLRAAEASLSAPSEAETAGGDGLAKIVAAKRAELKPIFLDFADRPRGPRIYMASKTAHGPRWRQLRADGVPIISTWIDEAGVGETACFTDLWQRCVDEASTATVVIVYREPGEVLKGAFVEVGAALSMGVPVYAVGCDEFSFVNHASVTRFDSLDDALRAAEPTPANAGAEGGQA